MRRRHAWAALTLCAAADLRIETDVSLEVMMDDEPKTLQRALDEDPEQRRGRSARRRRSPSSARSA